MQQTADRKEQMKLTVMLMTAISFMFCLYAPMELYFVNLKDFWFDIYVLFPIMFAIFAMVAIGGSLAMLALRWVTRKWYSFFLTVVFAGYLAFYIQGNYLVGNLPVLNGYEPDWSGFTTDKMISALVFGGMLVLCIVLWRKLGEKCWNKVVFFGSSGISLMLLMTGIILMISSGGLIKKQMSVATTENEFVMSTDTNLIVLLVDMVDSKTTDVLFTQNPEYAQQFENFTYYPNTVAGYNCTMESVPFIFSGIWYENERPLDDYLAEVYSEAMLFNRLEEAGYRMDLYTNCVNRVEDESIYRFPNVKEISVGGINDYPGFIKLVFKHVGLRYFPYQWKEYCFTRMYTTFDDYRQLTDAYELVNEENNGIFYEKLQRDNLIQLTDEKVFKFIHLEGGHMPFHYNKEMEWVGEATYEEQIEGTMTIVNTYLEQLKAAGVYDNSAIVVMADHGHDPENESRGPRYNAFLMVKGIGEEKAFSVSDAPISHIDMPEAFLRLTQGKASGEIFDWKEGDERERRFFSYAFGWESEMTEYSIGTDSKDPDMAQPTGRIY